jgi:hypothetical protein
MSEGMGQTGQQLYLWTVKIAVNRMPFEETAVCTLQLDISLHSDTSSQFQA